LAVVGGRERVRQGLEAFVAETEVDELMIVTTTYDPAARLRSYERVAEMGLEKDLRREVESPA
ncbi:MAG: hypothetical protein WBD10_08500, partial [Acidobacteriaceae bacterium]